MRKGLRSPKNGSAQSVLWRELPKVSNARYCPSRDQLDGRERERSPGSKLSVLKRRLSSPTTPNACWYEVSLPSRFDANTIVRPSGDHTGNQSVAGFEVIRVVKPF